jgi:F-type H+-transporting ATPase subunit delta
VASVTITYARAFADVVFDQHLDAAKTVQEAQALASLVTDNKELREVWTAPSIPGGQKRALLDAIAEREGFSRPVRNFMAVLMDHRRVEFLEPIVEQFELEISQRLGFVEAEVVSARELGPDERSTLESELEKMTGKKIRARYSRDPSLLGGAVVRMGSTIYDGSVKGKLQRIQAALSEAN